MRQRTGRHKSDVTKPRRRRRRVARATAVLLVVLFVFVPVARHVIEQRIATTLGEQLSAGLGLDVRVSGVRLGLGEQRVQRLAILDPADGSLLARFGAAWPGNPLEVRSRAHRKAYRGIRLEGEVLEIARLVDAIPLRSSESGASLDLSLDIPSLQVHLPSGYGALTLSASLATNSSAVELEGRVRETMHQSGGAALHRASLVRLASGGHLRLAGEVGGRATGTIRFEGPLVNGQVELGVDQSGVVVDGTLRYVADEPLVWRATTTGDASFTLRCPSGTELSFAEATLDRFPGSIRDMFDAGQLEMRGAEMEFGTGGSRDAIDMVADVQVRRAHPEAPILGSARARLVHRADTPPVEISFSTTWRQDATLPEHALMTIDDLPPEFIVDRWSRVEPWATALGSDSLRVSVALEGDTIEAELHSAQGRARAAGRIDRQALRWCRNIDVTWSWPTDGVSAIAAADQWPVRVASDHPAQGRITMDEWLWGEARPGVGHVQAWCSVWCETPSGNAIPLEIMAKREHEALTAWRVDVVLPHDETLLESATARCHLPLDGGRPEIVRLEFQGLDPQRVAELFFSDADIRWSAFPQSARSIWDISVLPDGAGGWQSTWRSGANDVQLAYGRGGSGDHVRFDGTVQVSAAELDSLEEQFARGLLTVSSTSGVLSFSGEARRSTGAPEIAWAADASLEPASDVFHLQLAQFSSQVPGAFEATAIELGAEGDSSGVRWRVASEATDDLATESAHVIVAGTTESIGTIRADLTVADVRLLERMLGLVGRLEPTIGSRASAELDVRSEGDEHTITAIVEAETLRTEEPIRIKARDGVFALAKPAAVTWDMIPAAADWLVEHATPPRGVGRPLRLLSPAAVRLRAERFELPTPWSQLDDLAFAAEAEIAWMDAVSPARERVRVRDVRIAVDKDAGGPVLYEASGEHELGRLERTTGRLDVRGQAGRSGASTELECVDVPSSVVRRVLGFGETFSELVGPTLSGQVSSGMAGGRVEVLVRAQSDRADLAFAGHHENDLFVADEPVRVHLWSVSPALLGRVLGGTSVLGDLEHPSDQGPISVQIEGLRLPTGPRLTKLAGQFRVDGLALTATAARDLRSLLVLAELDDSGALLIKSEEIRGEIRRGRIELDPFSIHAARLPVDVSGSIDLRMRTLGLLIGAPGGLLADAAVLQLTQSLISTALFNALRPELDVPVYIRGSFDRPEIGIDLDLLGGGLLDDPETPRGRNSGLRRPGHSRTLDDPKRNEP